jgi:uncharacterized protein
LELRTSAAQLLVASLIAFLSLCAKCAEVIPPRPAHYFNDYANVVSASAAERFNKTLEDFERETSSQILVVVYPKMQSDSSIEDYTVRVAQSWGVGQKGTNNGAVLFVFIQDRKMFLQVGYGLEGALPDAVCSQIIENEIKPRFKAGDYEGGLAAGINAILAAAKGEYRGNGRTVADRNGGNSSGGLPIFVLLVIGLFVLATLSSLFRGRRRRYSSWGYGGWGYGGGGFWTGGGGFSGGGGGGGSGGGFSGGGGSFGGGGAGGSW